MFGPLTEFVNRVKLQRSVRIEIETCVGLDNRVLLCRRREQKSSVGQSLKKLCSYTHKSFLMTGFPF